MGARHFLDVNSEYINDYSYYVDYDTQVRVRVYEGPLEIKRFTKCNLEIKRRIYIALAETGRYFTPVYIGRSNNINQRICDHALIEWQFLVVFDIDETYYSNQEILACESNLMLLAAASYQYLPLNRKLSTKFLDSKKMLFKKIVDWLLVHNFDFFDRYTGCDDVDFARDYAERDLVGINTGGRGYEVLKYGTVILNFRYDSAGNVVVLSSSQLTERYAFAHTTSLARDSEDIRYLKCTYDIERRSKSRKFMFKRDLTFRTLSEAMSIAAIDNFPENYDWVRKIWHPLKRTVIDDAMLQQSQAFQLFYANWDSDLDLDLDCRSLLQCPRCLKKELEVLHLLGKADLLY